MIKRLPRFAETYFASLCADAGVICNSPDEDENGWDFFLQFPAQRSPKRPADMQPTGPEAFVQVKSTRRPPFDARMKLSNALRAVQGMQPFFLVLVVEEDGLPRLYARHVWEEEIARVLRRIRLAERAGDTSFNRREFLIRMTDVDQPADLLGWMRATIEAVKPSYAAEKARLLATVGHEDGFGTMDVKFDGSADDLLNLQLGLVDSLAVTRVRFVPQRFGIEAPHAQFEIENAAMQIEPVGKAGRLRLQGGRPTEEIFVGATLYNASLPDAGGTRHRWRVDAGPLRILGGDGDYKANLSLTYEGVWPLPELRLFLTLMRWRTLGPVGLQLYLNGQAIPLGRLTMDGADIDESWSELASWADALEAVAAVMPHAEPELSIKDLSSSAPLIGRFAGFVTSSSIRIDYDPEGPSEPIRAVVYIAACTVGDWSYLAVIERATKIDDVHDGRRTVVFGTPKILDTVVRKGPWTDHREEIETAYRAQIDRLGDSDTLWELEEIEGFIGRITA